MGFVGKDIRKYKLSVNGMGRKSLGMVMKKS